MALEQTSHTSVAVYIAGCAKNARPVASIRLKVRIGRLEENLHAVERCDDRLRLAKSWFI
jgi:hypothetical protein